MGQLLRCSGVTESLSEGDTWRGLQRSFDEDVQWLGQGIPFALGDRGLGAKQIGGEFYPGRDGSRNVHRAAENERIGTVERDARGVFEILAGWIDHREIETGFQKLQKRIAFEDERWGILTGIGERSLESLSHQRQAFGEKSLLRPEPKRSLRPRRKKSR